MYIGVDIRVSKVTANECVLIWPSKTLVYTLIVS